MKWQIEYFDYEKRTWVAYGSPMEFAQANAGAKKLSEAGWKTRLKKVE